MAEIRQKIISCPNGHYYDANRYDSCPYCGNGAFSKTVDPYSNGMPRTMDTGENMQGAFSPTIAPDSNTNDQMSKTMYVGQEAGTAEQMPVVGWVVVVEGAGRGTDYRIHTGYNYIGRKKGDIIISGDAAISAEKDTNITYVPQTRKFYIAHEQGKNVLLVNNLPVIGGVTELNNYDIISIGMTKLMFMGFCGETFDWSDSDA